MDCLSFLNTIVKGLLIALVLFVCLGRRVAPPVLFRTETAAGVKLESPDEPPKEEDPPRRDPDYYYQTTTIVLKVCFSIRCFVRTYSHDPCLDPGYTLSRARRLLALRAKYSTVANTSVPLPTSTDERVIGCQGYCPR